MVTIDHCVTDEVSTATELVCTDDRNDVFLFKGVQRVVDVSLGVKNIVVLKHCRPPTHTQTQFKFIICWTEAAHICLSLGRVS